MSSHKRLDPSDEFLAEHGELEDLALVAQGLSPKTPRSDLRTRILASAVTEARFARFAAHTARLLDLDEGAALLLLDKISTQSAWEPGLFPGMELFHVQGGPKVKHAITGFVRLGAGVTFPDHEHFGAERVLIVQGRCEDQGKIFGPGDEVNMGPHTSHSFTVLPGPDLVYLAVVEEGLRVGDVVLTPTDPRA